MACCASNHRSKGARLLALAAFAAACGERAPDTRTVTLHVPSACPADGAAYGTFHALGDFDAPGPTTGHLLGHAGEGLPEIGAAARAILVEATEDGRDWSGVAGVPPSGGVDVLLLPALASCALSASVDQRQGASLAPFGGGRVLVVGGSGDPNPRTFVADLTTGVVAPVGTGLLRQRTRASVTAFGDGALVAGGVGDDGSVLSTAEVYDPALDGFDQQRPIELGDARADHGAVVMAGGETLLVGGVGSDGLTPLDTMEVVDPSARTVRTEGVARLAFARRAPTVVRLASGEILVAGGLDAGGSPVSTLEWIAGDASGATKRPRDLVTGGGQAFAALDAGGALAVVAPPSDAAPGFQSVWIIGADGALEPGSPVPGSLTAPALFGAAQGAPVLWTGDRWLRWDPWAAAFAAIAVLDAAPARIGAAVASPDPGLALWLATDTPALTAFRFDVRGAYSPLPGALLVDDASELSPDRVPAPGVFAFDSSAGLVLPPGAAAFVTDRTYADVDVDVDAPTGEPAVVVLRDQTGAELEVGGASCPWTPPPGAGSVHVDRRGASVRWTASWGAAGACVGVLEQARVSVGLRAPASATRSVARNLRVARPAP